MLSPMRAASGQSSLTRNRRVLIHLFVAAATCVWALGSSAKSVARSNGHNTAGARTGHALLSQNPRWADSLNRARRTEIRQTSPRVANSMPQRGALQSYMRSESRLSNIERQSRRDNRAIRTGRALTVGGHAALNVGQVALSRAPGAGRVLSRGVEAANRALINRRSSTGAYSPRFTRGAQAGQRLADIGSGFGARTAPRR